MSYVRFLFFYMVIESKICGEGERDPSESSDEKLRPNSVHLECEAVKSSIRYAET